jgi:hypothetical protein
LRGVAVVRVQFLLARPLAGVIAGSLAFGLAGSGLALLAGHAIEGWVFMAAFAAGPSAVIALLPFRARIFSFGLGLVAVAGTSFLDVSGADNPMSILPWIAWCFAGAASVAELAVRMAAAAAGGAASEA